MAKFLPRLAGLATIDPGLIILGNPLRLLFSIDLILLPILFTFLYSTIVLIYCISHHRPFSRSVVQRVAAVLSGTFFLVTCTAIGALVSYILIDQLPASTQKGFAAAGISADIHLRLLGYTTNSLRGNILPLTGFLVGFAILISKVSHNPSSRPTTRLTREQRMTPYQRMLQERRRPSTSLVVGEAEPPAAHSVEHTPARPRVTYLHCRNQPLQTLEPEAVNYRPLG
jgi:hypothetical protein